MKTHLRMWVLLLALAPLSLKLKAQCTVSNIIIQNVIPVSSTATTCTIMFDASFTIENNNGNKWIFIHAWTEADYPNYFHCVNGHPSTNGAIRAPKANDLADAFLNIGLDNNQSTPVALTVYPPDPSVTLNPVTSVEKTVQADGSAVIILHGVTTTLPYACGTPTMIISDVWSSQSAQAQVAHCVNCGIQYAAGYINASGLANCATLTWGAVLTNQTSSSVGGTYRVYADINGDGYFSPSIDTAISASTAFTVGAGVGTTLNINGPIPSANANQDLFLVLTQSSGASTVVLLPSTVCAPLPVTFRSFTATRTNANSVSLQWQTATEVNNSGFALQRNLGNNTWQTITFIPTQAQGGNSSIVLNYSYTDVNNSRGISQYRIRQVDIDGHAKYSEVRSVRGLDQKSNTIIYPNPSSTGSVTIVFDNNGGSRDILLVDIAGRTIRQWKAVMSNTITVDNLVQGIYSVRILNRETGMMESEKIVVNGGAK